jgi:superfamily II DNA or RNA helicase
MKKRRVQPKNSSSEIHSPEETARKAEGQENHRVHAVRRSGREGTQSSQRGYEISNPDWKHKRQGRFFDRFRSGKVNCIVSTTVLDEGIDVPDADVAIVLSGSGSERQLMQRIGRVLRHRDGKTALVVEIVTRNTVEEKIAEKRCKALSFYGVRPQVVKI